MGETKVKYKMIEDPPNIPVVGSIASMNYWFGTQAQYDAILVKDANTIYFIEE